MTSSLPGVPGLIVTVCQWVELVSYLLVIMFMLRAIHHTRRR